MSYRKPTIEEGIALMGTGFLVFTACGLIALWRWRHG